MKKIFWIAAALALAGLCTTSCTEEELPGADATTSPLAGTLHLGAVMLDGTVISPSTRACPQGGGSLPSTRAWRSAAGETSAAAQEWRAAAAAGADTRVVTEGGVEHGSKKTVNLVITGFEEGDELWMDYGFNGSLKNGITFTSDREGGWTTTDAIKPNPEDGGTWAKAKIKLRSNGGFSSYGDPIGTALGLSNNVCRYSDYLIADTHAKTADDLQPGQYHIDTQLGSPTLGQVTVRLAHRRALLRLPADAARLSITGYPEQFSHLHELLAKVNSYYYRFTPVTVGGTQYWQAIVLATAPATPNDAYKLTEFIALIGPDPGADFGSTEEGTPGNHTFSKSDYTAPDGNLKTDDNGNSTLLKPITITLSEEVTMERNTRYPLTLTLSPHTATVTVGSSAPGWGADEEEIEYGGDINLVNDVYEVGDAKGLRTFAEIAKGNRSAHCKLTKDINLKGEPWSPIGGNSASAYAGTFDGAGHTIRNLTVSGDNFQGFFGYIDGATVKNLTIEGGTVTGEDWVGAIAGLSLNSTIENCHNLGVTVTANANGSYAGGIVGENKINVSSYTSTLTTCTNTGSVSGSYAGGIVGVNSTISGTSTLTACTNTGKVTGGDTAGGIVGKNEVWIGNSATVTDCYWLQGTATAGIGDGNGDITEIKQNADATALAGIATALTEAAKDKGYKFTVAYAPSSGTDIPIGTPLFTVTATQP